MTIFKQFDNISTDWERKKELNLGNQGYLNTAANFPEILEEISKITHLLKSFNKWRKNIWKYKDTILNHYSGKPVFLQVKCPNSQVSNTKDGDTIIRLK